MKESVMIVDRDDRMQGTMDKLAAHVTGTLHRALSVFIFNGKGELLLQQRAFEKYHSGGLWTNTCCSHPRLGEKTLDAAHRRLGEEMGLKSELHPMFSFYYRAKVSEELTEHEYDHVFFGRSDEVPHPDTEEVSAYKYISIDSLAQDIRREPGRYTVWLALCLDQVLRHYTNYINR